MNIKLGYYPVLDMFLSFRQIYSNERFRPFNKEMSSIEEKLTKEQKDFIDKFGLITNGYLSSIQNLLDMHLDNVSIESVLADILSKPESLLVRDFNQICDERILTNVEQELRSYDENKMDERIKDNILSIWQSIFAFTSAKYSKELFEKVSEIKKITSEKETLQYLCTISDRIHRQDQTLHFNIKPSLELDIEKIENIIIMPSVYASRALTFWYSGNNLIFYIALETRKLDDSDPSDMLLLNTAALNDKTRLKMLRYMARENCSASDLASYLDMNASTISRHLKLFKDTGFVDIYSQVGNTVVYSVNRSKIDIALKHIKHYLQID